MKAYIDAIGLQANGLEGWFASQPILKKEKAYQNKPLTKYSPLFLPANERRRVTNTIKLALRTAEETQFNALSNQKIPTLFACVDGDTEISVKMIDAVLMDDPLISPIHFHNSVHNAPAGYWMMGQKNTQAASSISAGKYQIATLFIEGMSQLLEPASKILLVAYDLPIDPKIENINVTCQPFAFGLILSQQQSQQSIASIETRITSKTIQTNITPSWFGENRAATFLPLLMRLAQNKKGQMAFPLSKTQDTEIKISPC